MPAIKLKHFPCNLSIYLLTWQILIIIHRNSRAEFVESYCKEIDIYLTILYLVIEFNKEKGLEEYYLAEFLFDLVIRLKEHFTKTFPLKKVI